MKPAPLKIAMIAACSFPAQHGTPSSVIEMCTKLQASGADIHVVTYYTRDFEADFPFIIHRISSFGTPRRRLGVGPSLRRILYDFLLVFKVVEVVRNERIDVIHSHNYEGGLAGWLASLVTRRPHIYHAHNTMIDELPQYENLKPKVLFRWLARLLDFWVPRTADHIIAITQQLGNFLARQGVDADRITVIPLEMSMDIFKQPNRRDVVKVFNLPPGPKVIYTGTLDVFQRLDYLVQAFACVRATCKDAVMVIVTNQYKDMQLQALQQQCAEHGVEDCTWIITESVLEDLPGFLRQADVAVVSRPDCPGFPMKIFNYMAAGAAIVCFANSASFLEDGVTALLARDHDADELADCILRVLKDPSLGKTLGESARIKFTEIEAQQQVPKLLEVYNKLCPKSHSTV